jgi:hypothetical protein
MCVCVYTDPALPINTVISTKSTEEWGRHHHYTYGDQHCLDGVWPYIYTSEDVEGAPRDPGQSRGGGGHPGRCSRLSGHTIDITT